VYRYETHLHTAETSACSRFEAEEIVEKYTRLGFRGVIVTDHFLLGNSTVPEQLPYAEKIHLFCAGYRKVKEAAEGTSLDVFFGLEYSHAGTDFLLYGLSEEWLLNHPEIMELSVNELCDLVKSEGGLVVQAHPYREAFYIDHIRLYPNKVGGIEVLNASNRDRSNRLARVLAEEYGLPMTAGSDTHGKWTVSLAGMEFETPLKDEKDFADRVSRGEGKIFTLKDNGEQGE